MITWSPLIIQASRLRINGLGSREIKKLYLKKLGIFAVSSSLFSLIVACFLQKLLISLLIETNFIFDLRVSDVIQSSFTIENVIISLILSSALLFFTIYAEIKKNIQNGTIYSNSKDKSDNSSIVAKILSSSSNLVIITIILLLPIILSIIINEFQESISYSTLVLLRESFGTISFIFSLFSPLILIMVYITVINLRSVNFTSRMKKKFHRFKKRKLISVQKVKVLPEFLNSILKSKFRNQHTHMTRFLVITFLISIQSFLFGNILEMNSYEVKLTENGNADLSFSIENFHDFSIQDYISLKSELNDYLIEHSVQAEIFEMLIISSNIILNSYNDLEQDHRLRYYVINSTYWGSSSKLPNYWISNNNFQTLTQVRENNGVIVPEPLITDYSHYINEQISIFNDDLPARNGTIVGTYKYLPFISRDTYPTKPFTIIADINSVNDDITIRNIQIGIKLLSEADPKSLLRELRLVILNQVEDSIVTNIEFADSLQISFTNLLYLICVYFLIVSLVCLYFFLKTTSMQSFNSWKKFRMNGVKKQVLTHVVSKQKIMIILKASFLAFIGSFLATYAAINLLDFVQDNSLKLRFIVPFPFLGAIIILIILNISLIIYFYNKFFQKLSTIQKNTRTTFQLN